MKSEVEIVVEYLSEGNSKEDLITMLWEKLTEKEKEEITSEAYEFNNVS